jgi:hypothetical protein
MQKKKKSIPTSPLLRCGRGPGPCAGKTVRDAVSQPGICTRHAGADAANEDESRSERGGEAGDAAARECACTEELARITATRLPSRDCQGEALH